MQKTVCRRTILYVHTILAAISPVSIPPGNSRNSFRVHQCHRVTNALQLPHLRVLVCTRDLAGFKLRLRTPSPVAFCPCSSGPTKESSHGPATMLSRESQHGNAVEPLSRPLCLLSGILPCCAPQNSKCRGAQRLLGCRVSLVRRNLIACTVDTAPPKVVFHC
jgi:hypothetical protein